MTNVNLFFDLAGLSDADAARLEERFSIWFAADHTGIRRTSNPHTADFVIAFATHEKWKRTSIAKRRPKSDNLFVWDSDDFPIGWMPGLYASLPRELHDGRRHTTFCYPLRWNRFVACRPVTEARFLAGFHGAITSPLRARMLDHFQGRTDFDLRITTSLWNQMDAPSSVESKKSYADHLAHCKFVLCPRGNGVGSVRLFETLETGRVPVVISDRYVPPPFPSWTDFVIHVPERQLQSLPRILEKAEPQHARIAANAAAWWREHYADDRILQTMVGHLQIIKMASPSSILSQRLRYARFLVRQAPRDGLRVANRILRRFWSHLRTT